MMYLTGSVYAVVIVHIHKYTHTKVS